MSAAPTLGAIALKAWIANCGRKAAFDALWRQVGWGAITVNAVLSGDVVPDPEIADALANVTNGTVQVEMFSVPARVNA